ncbi:calcium-binding protein, partial [Acinetobacter baumannii]
MATSARADDAARQSRQHAGDHRVLVLGEFHGTRETPLLVRRLVDDYSRNGPVVLALELPRGENTTLRDYLDSDGGAVAR